MSKIAVVVISYNPKVSLKNRLEAIDCVDIFLYNNSKESFEYENKRIFVYGLGSNKGLAAPLNELMVILMAKGYTHFVFSIKTQYLQIKR